MQQQQCRLGRVAGFSIEGAEAVDGCGVEARRECVHVMSLLWASRRSETASDLARFWLSVLRNSVSECSEIGGLTTGRFTRMQLLDI